MWPNTSSLSSLQCGQIHNLYPPSSVAKYNIFILLQFGQIQHLYHPSSVAKYTIFIFPPMWPNTTSLSSLQCGQIHHLHPPSAWMCNCSFILSRRSFLFFSFSSLVVVLYSPFLTLVFGLSFLEEDHDRGMIRKIGCFNNRCLIRKIHSSISRFK